MAIVFVRDGMELKRLATSFSDLEEDAVLWVCYPRGGSERGTDLDRDSVRSAMEKHELSEASAIDFDDAWSAMRFRAPEDVGS